MRQIRIFSRVAFENLEMMQMFRANRSIPVLVLACLAASCGSDKETGSSTEGAQQPLYAVVSSMFSDSGSFTYVNLIPSLSITRLESSDAREFSGSATVAANSGKLFIGKGESPEVTRYSVTDDHEWLDEGTLSFANHLSTASVRSLFVDAKTAYAPVDMVARVIWNPQTLDISEVRDAAPGVPLQRDGLRVNLGYDNAVRGKRVYQPVYWADESFQTYSETSQIVIYDTVSHDVSSVLDVPCPHLHIVSRDPAGNLYFSNGSLSGTAPLFDEQAPRNCVVRIKNGEDTIDENFSFHFADVAEGREGAGFRMLDERRALFAAFHHEDVEIGEDTEPTSVNYSANWHLWTFDLETRRAAPLEGVEAFAGQYLVFRIDGRNLISFPAADYASTTTHEILTDGTIEKLFSSMGWTYDLVRVR